MPKSFIERKTTLSNGTMQKGLVMEMSCKKEKEGSIQSEKKEAYCLVHSALGRRKWLKEKEKLNKKRKNKRNELKK